MGRDHRDCGDKGVAIATRRFSEKMGDAVRFVQDLLLGGTSGVIAKTTCAPLERIKIILQVQSANTGGTKVCDSKPLYQIKSYRRQQFIMTNLF